MPTVQRFPVTVEGDYLVFRPPLELVHIPQELFLRELLVAPLDAGEDVAEFLGQFGAITFAYEPLRLPYGPVGLLPFEEPEIEKHARADHLRVEDARRFLRTARLLSRHWLAAAEGDSVLAAWEEEGLADLISRDEEWAWQRFVDCLNYGLSNFPVRVERQSELVPGIEHAQGALRVQLYSALCLQIVNHIAENAVARRCANETCRSPFVRQRGGEKHGQFKTGGVIYCKPSCANTQWQRENRRRKRAEGSQS